MSGPHKAFLDFRPLESAATGGVASIKETNDICG